MARVNVLGVGIHDVNPQSALLQIVSAARTPGFAGYVTATSVHGVVASQEEPELKRIHNQSFLTLPDGIPLVWLGRAHGHEQMRQVAGAALMPALFVQAGDARHFLWGGGEGVVDKLQSALRQRYPHAHIVAARTPPFRPLTPSEDAALLAAILETRPHFFWVGLSTPKQEHFMADFLARHREQLHFAEHGLVMLGVGAAFDFQAGTAQEAPPWLRGSGLEWLFRLQREPRRLAGRYLRNNPRFLLGIARQFLHPERYPLE